MAYFQFETTLEREDHDGPIPIIVEYSVDQDELCIQSVAPKDSPSADLLTLADEDIWLHEKAQEHFNYYHR